MSRLLPILAPIALSLTLTTAPCQQLHEFKDGEVASATQVNENFNALATRLAEAEAKVRTLTDALETAKLDNAVMATKLAALLSKIEFLQTDDGNGNMVDTIRFKGVNVQIVNGLGATNGSPSEPFGLNPGNTNGAGNLILGYDERRNATDQRTGSHNLVIGPGHRHSQHGSIVAGLENQTSAPYTIAAGQQNRTGSPGATTLGGRENTANGIGMVIAGGKSNQGDGTDAFFGGGTHNQIRGPGGRYAAIVGGGHNTCTGQGSAILGGGGAPTQGNTASGDWATVSGGRANSSGGYASAIGGGFRATIPSNGADDWRGGQTKYHTDW